MQVMLSCTHGEVGVVVAQILNHCNYTDIFVQHENKYCHKRWLREMVLALKFCSLMMKKRPEM